MVMADIYARTNAQIFGGMKKKHFFNFDYVLLCICSQAFGLVLVN